MNYDDNWFWDEWERDVHGSLTKPELVLIVAALVMILGMLGAIAYLIVVSA